MNARDPGDVGTTIRVGSIFRVTGGGHSDITFRPDWQLGPWESLVWRVVDEPGSLPAVISPLLRGALDHPSREELAQAIRDNPRIPTELRNLVAHRLEDPPRGRPKKGQSPREVAEAIRSCPGVVPSEVGQYIAGRLEGTIRPPNHRPEEDNIYRLFLLSEIALKVRMHQAAFRILRIKEPRARAIRLVAKEQSLSPETLRSKLIRAVRDAKPLLQGMDIPAAKAVRVADEIVHARLGRLDPEKGLVWLHSADQAAPRHPLAVILDLASKVPT